MRVDLEDIWAISVAENVPGAEWFEVPCDTPMKGVSASEWLEVTTMLRHKHADHTKLSEPIVLAALRDLRATGLQSALAAGIGPSPMSRDEILKQEKLHLQHFSIVPADTRGLTLDDYDDDGVLIEDAEDLSAGGDYGPAEVDEPQPVTRRRGRLGTDFLKED